MEVEAYQNDTDFRVVFNLKNPTRDYSHDNMVYIMVTVFGVCVWNFILEAVDYRKCHFYQL